MRHLQPPGQTSESKDTSVPRPLSRGDAGTSRRPLSVTGVSQKRSFLGQAEGPRVEVGPEAVPVDPHAELPTQGLSRGVAKQ
jgi:hypothetical protein